MKEEAIDFMRRKIIAGNWKMNQTPSETKEFFEKFNPLIEKTNHQVIICVPFVDLCPAKKTKADTIALGAQNMHFEDKGAYTGEISGQMLKAMEIPYVIIGHSERREYFAETDETVNLKLKKAISCGITPILCVGETLEERENGKAREKVVMQIQKDLEGIEGLQVKSIIIAYEPIWAIGTGKTASKEEANEVCKWIREEIQTNYGKQVADEIAIVYGGSVKSSNAKELFTMSDIDGGLVGGASLKAEEFAKIVNYDEA